MTHKYSKTQPELSGEFGVLRLELCPDPEQVMPPARKTAELPMALTVCGNLVVATVLLGAMLLLPAFIASLLGIN